MPSGYYADRLRYWAQTQAAPNSQHPWTTQDMARIVDADRPSDRQLSAELGRSMQAIQVMRCRIRRDGAHA